MFDKFEESSRRKIGELAAAEAKLRAQMHELTKERRSVKARLASTTKHENWHAHRLAHLDRLAGYSGEMASARIYIRSLPLTEYISALTPFAEQMPNADNLAIEVAAVKANHDDWHNRGEEIVLARARVAAEADHAGWEEWQSKNPTAQHWRDKPMTKGQFFLVSRTADLLSIIAPAKMTRGEAHDWLSAHGGNLRLAREKESVGGNSSPERNVGRSSNTTGMACGVEPDSDGGMVDGLGGNASQTKLPFPPNTNALDAQSLSTLSATEHQNRSQHSDERFGDSA